MVESTSGSKYTAPVSPNQQTGHSILAAFRHSQSMSNGKAFNSKILKESGNQRSVQAYSKKTHRGGKALE